MEYVTKIENLPKPMNSKERYLFSIASQYTQDITDSVLPKPHNNEEMYLFWIAAHGGDSDTAAETAEKISSIEKNVASLQSGLSGVNTIASSNAQSILSINTNIDGINTSISGINSNISKINTSVSANSDSINSVQSNVNSLSSKVSFMDSTEHNIYGSVFDMVKSQGTRMYASSNLSWSKSTDLSAGVDDFKNRSPFNTYEVLTKPDSNGVSQIVGYEGDYIWSTYRNDPTFGADVITMFEKSYIKRSVDSSGKGTWLVSDKYIDGFYPSPMHLRNGKLYNVIGITRYGVCDDGNNGICSRSGLYQKINFTEAQFETALRARGMRVMGINEYGYLQMLGSIKYNNLNWQSAVGNGVVSTYASVKATVSESSVSRVIVSNSDAVKFSVGNPVHVSVVGTGINFTISSISDYDTSNKAIKLIGQSTTFSTVAGSTTIEMSCTKSGGCDPVLGLDGEVSVGSAGTKSVLTMGLENLYGNCFKELSGIVRIDKELYINPNPDSNPTWPSSASDATSKGWIKVNGTFSDTTGYIKTFIYDSKNPHILIPSAIGGDSSNPVGDYYYTNSDASPHIVLLGGNLNYGAYSGPFFANLSVGVAASGWNFGAFGVFIPPV
jgi:archaellum component FlaC